MELGWWVQAIKYDTSQEIESFLKLGNEVLNIAPPPWTDLVRVIEMRTRGDRHGHRSTCMVIAMS